MFAALLLAQIAFRFPDGTTVTTVGQPDPYRLMTRVIHPEPWAMSYTWPTAFRK